MARILGWYTSKKSEGQGDLTASGDDEYILDKIALMTEQQAIEILTKAIDHHKDDPNFPAERLRDLKLLIEQPDCHSLDLTDHGLRLRIEAAIIHYHSPYPEVRSVTTPNDDTSIPVETLRAYVLGLLFMGGCTAVNTFFSPRQPAISISAVVMQILVAPCGMFLARVVPAWDITIFGTRYPLNPGPWSYKEQVFATIIFTVSNTPGSTYYVYLVQRLPQYLGNSWVTFGYEITLALSVQLLGIGFAGLLRRFVVYPATALFPKVFPTLALNRALVMPEKQDETINGWKFSRYRFFVICTTLMFVWFWVPNFLFQALRSFNWMTWIAPENFALGMITGFWGGMGFNPVATFDWNVSGSGSLVTPFFSTVQHNEAFANDGTRYNVTRIISKNGDGADQEAYRAYGPPFFSGANIFGQGAWFAWYPMTLTSVSIQHWDLLKSSAVEMYRGFVNRKSVYENYHDPHTRMMAAYPEVPDWWFACILILSLTLGIVALAVWPLSVPIWSLFAVIGISAVMLIPSVLLLASANVTVGFNVLFQMLGGVWFAGNPEALIIVTAFGQTFNPQAENYIADQKMGHYAKIPPRAVFRGQVIAVVCNCFIFVGMLDWMVTNFDEGTLCRWDNPQHFVCTDAVLVFASAIEYGAFGVRNMFELYPILPWCFLAGAVVGTAWGFGRRYGPGIRKNARLQLSNGIGGYLETYLFGPMSWLKWFDPAVFWSGALQWTGGNNLSYATNGLYLSFIFMYFIKRRYMAWWRKYNYLIEAGFGVGVAISAIIQTFALSFPGIEVDWWGNSVSTAGLDYQAYNQNATLLSVPKGGYFGPSPDDYPMKFS
ncbi:oligopeptide transporter 6 [Diatrype stigma]|uniref:Oligopeptide transporter 6 n=1 Tax=Diatrype stigma TaxID=117547 RepID=A0AAN9U5L5_9PEZI